MFQGIIGQKPWRDSNRGKRVHYPNLVLDSDTLDLRTLIKISMQINSFILGGNLNQTESIFIRMKIKMTLKNIE